MCTLVLWKEDGFEDHAEDILKNYKEFSEKKPINKETTSTLIGDSKDTDDKIKNLIMKQQEQVSTDSDKNAKAGRLVDNEMKKLVLNQYNNRGASDGSDDSDGESAAMPSGFQNVNAESVVRKQQEQRDKAKKASDEKKVRDKLNRDVQKQKKDDRKEKEKQRTQKGERRK
ncbi:coiled-coil domain-containing protein 43-like [Clytia hemisphaerica]